MSVPGSSITANVLAQNLLTDGPDQYAVLITSTGRVRVGRRAARGEWTTTTIPATMLGQPVTGDEHCYPTLALDDDGFIFVWANMHVDPYRCVRSLRPRDIGGWKQVSLPGKFTRNTYPVVAKLADGTLWLHLRAGALGGPGRGDSHVWMRRDGQWWYSGKLFKGVNVAGGSGPAVDDATNWSAYPVRPHVEQSGRVHLAWCWRRYGTDEPAGGDASRTNELLSYAWTDDGVNWHAIDGTPLALPIDPVADTACHTGLVLDQLVNGGGITLDDAGLPHVVIGQNPYHHAWWDGQQWGAEQIADPLGGVNLAGFATIHNVDGKLWLLVTQVPAPRRLVLVALDGSEVVELAVPGVEWSTHADPGALSGHVEVLVPDGNQFETVTVGLPSLV